MAGVNKKLQAGQPLFTEGERADAMYIVRKGELKIFKKTGEHEILLAKVNDGGMVGEMAFFDQKPRSASVAASTETEVTVISSDDFAKLMKQIPRWFVALMGTLSSRLRITNERLQELEAKKVGATAPFEHTLKILYIIDLLFHKEGVKEGKDWLLNQTNAAKTTAAILNLNLEAVVNVLNQLANQKVFISTQDQYRNSVFALSNRGNTERLTAFMKSFISDFPDKRALPPGAIEMLTTLQDLADKSAYDAVSVSIDELLAEGERAHLDINSWKQYCDFFKRPNDALSIQKTSDTKFSFKVNRKELPKFIEAHKLLAALAKANCP